MFPRFRSTYSFILLPAISIVLPSFVCAQGVPSIRNIQVLRGSSQVEIEIESSAAVIPQTNELGNPDRLLVDFVNAKPGAALRNLAVNRAEVRDLRVALFSADPPVTRVVLDLNGPQPYQVFPSGRTTIVKIGKAGAQAAQSNPAADPVSAPAGFSSRQANATGSEAVAPAPQLPELAVAFQDGMLSIRAERATLSEVLFAVHQRTGAEIGIPAGAEQEQVAADLGPAPATKVLADLLNGSKFNFLILSSPNDPLILDQVILSPRAEGPMQAQAAIPQPVQQVNNEPEEQAEEPSTEPPPPPGRQMLQRRLGENPNANGGEIEAPAQTSDPPPTN
jgi:hypothetical protein